MKAKPKTKSEHIRQIYLNNPNAKRADIIKKVKCSGQLHDLVRAAMRREERLEKIRSTVEDYRQKHPKIVAAWEAAAKKEGTVVALDVTQQEDEAMDVLANEIQIGGDHYKSKTIQPWDAIRAWGLGFFDGNVIKYVARHREKNGIEDLKKARHYLDKLIELMEKGK